MLYSRSYTTFWGALNGILTRKVSSSTIRYCQHVPLSFRGSQNAEIRESLRVEIKAALKRKDTFTATTLRSVLSEIYAADKASKAQVPSGAILTIIHKATLRRHESATHFDRASRPDLAGKELREAALLAEFLPLPLSEKEIDTILGEAITEVRQQHTRADQDPRKAVGTILRIFYSRVDKTTLDSSLVKKRVEELWLRSL